MLDGVRRLADAAEEVPCRTGDPELWFATSPGAVERAKQLCQSCPVRRMCLDEAIARREPWGVWGGEIVLDGAVIPRLRRPGRPRKQPAVA